MFKEVGSVYGYFRYYGVGVRQQFGGADLCERFYYPICFHNCFGDYYLQLDGAFRIYFHCCESGGFNGGHLYRYGHQLFGDGVRKCDGD